MQQAVPLVNHDKTYMQHYLFFDNKLLLTNDNKIPLSSEKVLLETRFSLDSDEECIAAVVDHVPKNYRTVGLRDSYDLLPWQYYKRAGKAAELLYWEQTHQYCGRCGTKLIKTSAISKICPKCHKEEWPMLSPAIIVLVHNADKILLVRSNTFCGEYYGLVAGFVELGESVEEAVEREIKEETRLEVEKVQYFGSQPWPYPQGIMLGFFAHYKSGEICLQTAELVAGDWFDIHHLPEIPKPLSMARQLIDHYISTYDY